MNDADRDLFRKWADKAEEDLLAAAHLLGDEPLLPSVICFHCEQAAEKYLKALLAIHGEGVPKIHDLETLLGKAIDLGAPLAHIVPAARRLTDYAVDTRYPDAPFDVTADLARQAEQDARLVKTAVLEALQPPMGDAPLS